MPRIVLALVCLSGCARFIDERPPPADLAEVDAAEPDGDAAAGDTVLGAGQFMQAVQNGGDTGSGSVALVRASDGTEQLVFGADFTSTPVPAGEVVLTSRAAINQNGIRPGADLDLGALTTASGAQRYAVPGGDGGRRTVIVHCVTYGVDVAVAALK